MSNARPHPDPLPQEREKLTALQEAWRASFRPRDRRPIPEWLKQYVTLQAPITRTGPFDCSDSRHFIPIFGSLQNDRKRGTNILKPVRGGGSLIGDGFCPWTFANDPGPYMDVFQTDKVAEDHAEERIKKIFASCEPIRALLPINRHKERDNEILFSNGHTWYVRGPALANLQAKGLRYMRLEEVWMWPQGRMGEAMGRVGDYLKTQTSHILVISQAGPMDGVEMEESDWYRHYHRAQILEWEAQCLNSDCGKFYDPVFSGTRPDGSFWGMTWNRYMLPNGDWDIAKCVPTTRFECPHCAHPVLDGTRTKSEWNRTGRYRLTTEPNEKHDSFHWETVIDFPWDELVSLWLDACNAEKRGDLKPKLQFYQKRRAMFKDEESLLKGGLNLRRTVYDIKSKWADEEARFMSIDRQEEDLFWWTIRAWSKDKSRRLAFGKCYGFAALEKIREDWKVESNLTFCDSGYVPKGDNGVYAACVRYGWIAVKGDAEHSFAHYLKKIKRTVFKSYAPLSYGDPNAGVGASGRKYCYLIRFSKPQLNQLVQQLIDNGHWEEPIAGEDLEMEKEYNQQMASRVKKTEYNQKTGATKIFFKESKNDHARDLANQQVLSAILRELLPDPAAERLTKSEEKALAE